ncbi:hypothetical protein LEN26_007504 [Aphanomyces euteiches]|nr:hypothetical protein LEN26_007504 [Aphanomyces euteiches]KAH9189076.1 hypothetical protein AeNC1_008944 [Aphanomyces euteiches]
MASTIDAHLHWEDEGSLDFLPPVDQDLLNQVSGLNDAFIAPTRPEETSISSTQRRGPKRINVMKVEIRSLQEEKIALEEQLAVLASTHSAKQCHLSDDEKKWKQIAQKQLELKLKAMREHEQLRTLLAEHAIFQRELEFIVLKKPRLMVHLNFVHHCSKLCIENEDQWRALKLRADSAKRLLDIQAIANRQLELIDSEMLSLGLMDSTTEMNMVRHDTTKKYSEGIRSVRFQAASFDILVAAIWMHTVQMYAKGGSDHLIERRRIDDNTYFVSKAYTIPNTETKMMSRAVIKRQQVGPRAVRMILRSVLADDANPFPPNSIIADQCAWLHMEQDSDGSTVLKCYMRGGFTILKPDEVENLVYLMALCSSTIL